MERGIVNLFGFELQYQIRLLSSSLLSNQKLPAPNASSCASMRIAYRKIVGKLKLAKRYLFHYIAVSIAAENRMLLGMQDFDLVQVKSN